MMEWSSSKISHSVSNLRRGLSVFEGMDWSPMPIEFNCRICNAMIRVPDKSAGGKGKCPKCGIRITVPKKSAVKPISKPTEPEVQYEFPGVGGESDPEPDSELPEDPDAVVTLETAKFEPEDLQVTEQAERPEFSLDRPMEPPRPSKSVRRKKQNKQNKKTIIIATVAVLAALAGFGFFVLPLLTAESVRGELIAGTAQTLELPPVLIDKSSINFSGEELTVLLKKLEASPIPITSNSMQITLGGSPRGLEISVASTAQSHFYRISLKKNEAVEKYLDKHLSDFNKQRQQEIDDAVPKFFKEYQAIIAKKSKSDVIASFRDELALPALVGGLGYFLVAESGRGNYRCVYEDRSGGLYFLLPADLSEFKVTGRRGTDDRPLIPFDFHVKVKGEIVPLKKPEEKLSTKPAESKPKATEEKSKMESEEMDGKN